MTAWLPGQKNGVDNYCTYKLCLTTPYIVQSNYIVAFCHTMLHCCVYEREYQT